MDKVNLKVIDYLPFYHYDSGKNINVYLILKWTDFESQNHPKMLQSINTKYPPLFK